MGSAARSLTCLERGSARRFPPDALRQSCAGAVRVAGSGRCRCKKEPAQGQARADGGRQKNIHEDVRDLPRLGFNGTEGPSSFLAGRTEGNRRSAVLEDLEWEFANGYAVVQFAARCATLAVGSVYTQPGNCETVMTA